MYAVILGNLKDPMDNQQQRFLLYRWHEKDPIYFEKGFRMVIDNLGEYYDEGGNRHRERRYDDYTSTAYFYLDEPAPLPFELPDNEAVSRR